MDGPGSSVVQKGADITPPAPPSLLRRRFEAIVFDWDGTAVAGRTDDATAVRGAVERLCRLGMHVAVVSGTNVDNVDGQLCARPAGPGRLYLLLNRGSEAFAVDERGVQAVWRRTATQLEEDALTTAAARTSSWLAARGVRTAVVSARLNRRKVDLIPEPAWADPPKARIEELLTAVERRLRTAGIESLRTVVGVAQQAAAEAGLPDSRVTSDAKHVEIGLTDKADSARWILAELWRLGVGPSRVLIVGDEMGPLGGLPGSDSLMLVPESRAATAVSVGVEPNGVPRRVTVLPGGPAALLALMEEQAAVRERGAIPEPEDDGSWTLTVRGLDPELERVHETLLCLADGRIGTRGAPFGEGPAATPVVLMAGLYTGEGSTEELAHAPLWNRLSAPRPGPGDALYRVLDLHAGTLWREARTGGGAIRAFEFSSLARPGVAVLRAAGPRGVLEPGPTLRAPDTQAAEAGETDGIAWMRTSVTAGGGALAAAGDAWSRTDDDRSALERMAAYAADQVRPPPLETALEPLRAAREAGFERLYAEHRETWAARWEDADVVVRGDPELQQAVRFALFHMMASVGDRGEAALGARGMSGPGYRGHVFWDGDVFVLPFLAATHPAAARAMLEYRIRRLPAAVEEARRRGRRGARLPWESAASGRDVTPSAARDRTGLVVPIRTGLLEEHIVADVAWAAACYQDWSGDETFGSGPGRTLLVETARYWASLARHDETGRAHVFGVIGPDEYHEPVDDNAYTNVMARWNLRRAAALAGDAVEDAERARWLEVADALVDGYDPDTGLYEQFSGFYDLEPLIIQDFAARRPVAADVLIGRERVRAAQIVKQADVLMLHHLVPEEVAPGSLEPNLLFYEPRTSHGSSLSPGVHAALFARAGRLASAARALDMVARLDLDDLTRTTAGGLHLAAMGTVWQAMAFGFAGLRPAAAGLRVDPRPAPAWEGFEVRVRFRGSRVLVRAEADQARVMADPPITALVGASGTPVRADAAGAVLRRANGDWSVIDS